MKKIKGIFITVLILLLISRYAPAQTGVYLSANDFANNKLSYASRCAAMHRHTIRLHGFFAPSSYLTVMSDGSKHKLKKKGLYGYRDCNNGSYRFYLNREYKIAEAGSIFIYTQTRNIAQCKGFKVINVYYFSAGPDGVIFPLSFHALKTVFARNTRFLDLLGYAFCTDELSEYDHAHNTFKLNDVYNKAMQQ